MRTDSTSRALQLLSLLQTHSFWPCAELAARLGVTERTVRRDLDRLRELGYPVDSISGRYGGYRLAAGAHLPPLILDDEEAVAVSIGLRHAAEAAVSGIEETSLRALAKIEALLPYRLRRRVSALHSSVASLRRAVDDDIIHPESLSVFAVACRDHEHVRFDYLRSDGESSGQRVEPHQLVTAGRRWYLVAWDGDRRDWRTFRLDRIREPRPVGSHFTPRTIPGGDAADFVASSIGDTRRDHDATLVVHSPLADVEGVLQWADHTVKEAQAERCIVRIRGEDLGRLAMTVAEIALTAPVTVIEPAELTRTIERLAAHFGSRPPSDAHRPTHES